ncbi:TRAP transporter substrate-binding protein [Roseomonas sp. AR75]|jgi:TRAP-type C4-dicarboxylate transport system substrate-binding protein|uniref:TRAP transporter substrate-binding protein n=1 Tax=Roseomonas sp. AR75 TaxID=2562311 RepID=UPI0010BFCF39|nr:TRAP transporter substrate-binding protein [Roseomonas sp. AR75]
MHRRHLFRTTLGLTLAAPLVARAQQVFTIRCHSFSSPTALDHTLHLDRWAERVGQQSQGRIKVEMYPAMQLGGQPRDLPQQLEDGVVDMIWTVPGFTPGRFMGTEGIEMPFMNTGKSATMSPAAYEYAAKNLASTEYRGIKIIAIHATDRALVHTSRKPIRVQEDFRGLRLRVAGRFIGEAVTALGATPVGIPLGGVYEATARNQVDGFLINWAITHPFRLYEVAKYHTEPAGTGLFQGLLLTLMSMQSYNRLPTELRAVIDANSGAELSRQLGEIWDTQTQQAIDATRAAGGEIIEIGPEEKARWRNAVAPAYEAWIAEMNRRGRNGRALFDEMMAITARYGRA